MKFTLEIELGNDAAQSGENVSEILRQLARPLAAAGLTSYRCKGRYGYIMIGAKDDDDAMREALRSSDAARRENLEVWDGNRYVRIGVSE